MCPKKRCSGVYAVVCRFLLYWFLPVMLFVGNAHAAASAYAENFLIARVQAPAWIERDQQLQAITPGLQLQSGDRLRTGRSGRVEVRLSTGRQFSVGGRADVRLLELTKNSLSGQTEVMLKFASGGFALYPLPGSANNQTLVTVALRKLRFSVSGAQSTLYGQAAPNNDLGCVEDGFAEFSLINQQASQANSLIELSSGNCYSLQLSNPDEPNIVEIDKLVEHSLASAVVVNADEATQAVDGQWQIEFRSSLSVQQLRNEGYAAKPLQDDLVTVAINQLESEKHATWMGERLQRLFNVKIMQIRRLDVARPGVVMGQIPQPRRPAVPPPSSSIPAASPVAVQSPVITRQPEPRSQSSVPPKPTIASKKIWVINIAAYRNQGSQKRVAMQGELEQMGFQVAYRPVVVNGENWVRVSVGPFTEKRQAENFLPKIAGRFRSLNGLWLEALTVPAAK